MFNCLIFYLKLQLQAIITSYDRATRSVIVSRLSTLENIIYHRSLSYIVTLVNTVTIVTIVTVVL